MNTPHKHLDNSENRIPAITWVSLAAGMVQTAVCAARAGDLPLAHARDVDLDAGVWWSMVGDFSPQGGSCSRCEPPEMVRPSVWRATPRCADNLTVFSHCTCRARALGVYRGGAAGVTRQVLRKFTSLLSRFR